MQITCTCPARAMYTPGQLLIWRLDAPVQMCQCAKFCVASSKNSQTRRIPYLKSLPPLARAFVPLIAAYRNGTCSLLGSIGPQNLSRLRLLVWPAALKNKKEGQISWTCPARAMCTPGQLFIWRRYVPVQMCQCAEFGFASSKINKLGGSHD